MFLRSALVFTIWICCVQCQKPPKVPQLFSRGSEKSECYDKLYNLLKYILAREAVQQFTNHVQTNRTDGGAYKYKYVPNGPSMYNAPILYPRYREYNGPVMQPIQPIQYQNLVVQRPTLQASPVYPTPILNPSNNVLQTPSVSNLRDFNLQTQPMITRPRPFLQKPYAEPFVSQPYLPQILTIKNIANNIVQNQPWRGYQNPNIVVKNNYQYGVPNTLSTNSPLVTTKIGDSLLVLYKIKDSTNYAPCGRPVTTKVLMPYYASNIYL